LTKKSKVKSLQILLQQAIIEPIQNQERQGEMVNTQLLRAALKEWPDELIADHFKAWRVGGYRYCVVGWLHEFARRHGRCTHPPKERRRALEVAATQRCIAKAFGLHVHTVRSLMHYNDDYKGKNRGRSLAMWWRVEAALQRYIQTYVSKQAGQVLVSTGFGSEEEKELVTV